MASRGTVYQRKSDGRWVGKLQMPNDPLTGKPQKPKHVYSSVPPTAKDKWKLDKDGKPIPPAHTKGKQEVERKLEALIKEVDAGAMVGHSKLTVEKWLEKYLAVYCADLAETTREGYKRYIENHMTPILGKLTLKELKSIHIQNFYNAERKAGYSEKTILQEHRILKRALEKAVTDGFIMKNPCSGVKTPSPIDYEPTIYTEDEFALLLDKLEGHRMEAIILIAGMCGLRRGELLGLTWEDIDLDKGIITVQRNVVPTSEGSITKDPKTRRSAREFSIPSGIIPRLKQLRGIGSIYTKEDGTEYHPGSVSRDFKTFLEVNKLKHIRLHDLRHFNGTMMLKHGVTEREASERLGHSNLMMTKKYQHVLKDMDQSSADKLNSVLKTKEK